MSTAIQQVGNYLEIFTEFAKSAPGQNVPWLRKLREEAFARFCEAGFPTTHDEDWRFTNTSPIARTRFAFAKQLRALSRNDLNAWTINRAAARLVFIDGRFAPELSDSARFAGVQISSLKDQIASHPDELEPHLASYANIQRDAFCALNTAFIQDGTYIHVRRGTVLEQPVHLLFISIESDAPTMAHPRNLVVFEDESQGTVIEEYVSIGKGTALCNSVTELVVGENATVSHYMVECEHRDAFNVSTLRIQQARSANVASHSLLLGGGLVRNNVHPVLAGEGGECLINGLFVGDGRQHLDNYMYVEHAKPHCSSRQFYNGILDGHGHGVFHGRIIVHKDAQKTDAKQTNRNLLLSDDAQIDTKPQLEIYADDVKCTHGATIGQIEENALFYLQSRGIDETSARRLLLLAFASECLDRMRPGVAREHAEHLIHKHLISFANHRSTTPASADKARSWEEVG